MKSSAVMTIVLMCLSAADGALPFGVEGFSGCQCANASQLPQLLQSSRDKIASLNVTSIDEYGIGCKKHDLGSTACVLAPDNALCDQSIQPRPSQCTRKIPSYCDQFWCYVDKTQCSTRHEPSVLTQEREFSYATCGSRDMFTDTLFLDTALKGVRTLSNSSARTQRKNAGCRL